MNNLKLNRIIRGWSQQRLASACGFTQSTYSRIERGLRALNREERVRIATVLGLPPETVFGGEPDQRRFRRVEATW